MTTKNAEFDGLITRVRAGDPSALGELLDRFGAVVRAAVRRKLPDRLRQEFDSLDFVQDVWASFLALPTERMTFPQPEELAAFLARVARNKVVGVVRQRFGTKAYDITRKQPLPEDGGSETPKASDPSPSQWAIAGEKWLALTRKLTPGELKLLERLRDGYTLPEIASLLGTSLSTVNRMVRRLKKLCDETGT